MLDAQFKSLEGVFDKKEVGIGSNSKNAKVLYQNYVIKWKIKIKNSFYWKSISDFFIFE